MTKDLIKRLYTHIISRLNGKVDKEDGKGLSSNDYTNADKTKLDGIETGANKTIVDSSLSSTSTNPVQNKVIKSALDNKSNSNHTHNYAGSSSAGGAATSANKLNTNAGSATQPVYFNNGVPVATTYSLNKTVPADAAFTDTVYTHPSYTSRSSGLYKITVNSTGHVSGATSVAKSDITGLGIASDIKVSPDPTTANPTYQNGVEDPYLVLTNGSSVLSSIRINGDNDLTVSAGTSDGISIGLDQRQYLCTITIMDNDYRSSNGSCGNSCQYECRYKRLLDMVYITSIGEYTGTNLFNFDSSPVWLSGLPFVPAYNVDVPLAASQNGSSTHNSEVWVHLSTSGNHFISCNSTNQPIYRFQFRYYAVNGT